MSAPTSYTYQWNLNGATIAGATGATYTIRAADRSDTVGCTVTATNSAGSTTAAAASVVIQSQSPVAFLGALNADPSHLDSDAAAGFNLVEIECGWNEGEPTQGVISSSYLADRVAVMKQYKDAGYEVAVSLGIHYPPTWVLSLADGQYVDQYGNASGTPNWLWNPAVRAAAARYINTLVTTIASSVIVDYFRVGLGDAGEMYLPTTSTHQWYAFDTLAQGSSTSDLPAGVEANPMPGWVPGDPTWIPPGSASQAVTVATATSWWNWYMNAWVNAHAWEISTIRSAGWTGRLQLVMVGPGAVPSVITARLKQLLAPMAGNTADNTMESAACWPLMLEQLPDITNCVVDISGLIDGSGVPINNASEAGDATMTLAQADPYVSRWSGPRFITYLAGARGLEVMGENPGYQLANQVANVFRQAEGCGLIGIMWAFDNQMYDSVHATAAQVAAGHRAAFHP